MARLRPDQRGNALMVVLIASAVSIVLLSFAMQVIRQRQLEIARVQDKAELADVVEQAKFALSIKDKCNYNFGGGKGTPNGALNPSNLTGYELSFPELRDGTDASGQPLFIAGQHVGLTANEVDQIRLINWRRLSGNRFGATLQITVNAPWPQRPVEFPGFVMEIPPGTYADPDITSCSLGDNGCVEIVNPTVNVGSQANLPVAYQAMTYEAKGGGALYYCRDIGYDYGEELERDGKAGPNLAVYRVEPKTKTTKGVTTVTPPGWQVVSSAYGAGLSKVRCCLGHQTAVDGPASRPVDFKAFCGLLGMEYYAPGNTCCSLTGAPACPGVIFASSNTGPNMCPESTVTCCSNPTPVFQAKRGEEAKKRTCIEEGVTKVGSCNCGCSLDIWRCGP